MGVVKNVPKSPALSLLAILTIVVLVIAARKFFLPNEAAGAFMEADAGAGADRALCTTQDGRPIIYYFGTGTTCSHCSFLEEPFLTAVERFSNESIAVHAWPSMYVQNVSKEDADIFDEFSDGGFVPTIVVGCKYFRIGAPFQYKADGALLEAIEITRAVCKILPEDEPVCGAVRNLTTTTTTTTTR